MKNECEIHNSVGRKFVGKPSQRNSVFNFGWLENTRTEAMVIHKVYSSFSTNPTKWSNTQIADKLPKNCLSVFDMLRGLTLKGLIKETYYIWHCQLSIIKLFIDFNFISRPTHANSKNISLWTLQTLGFPFHSKFDILVFCGLKSGRRLDMKISEKNFFLN